jgi:putative phage-type endonuclease
VIAHDVAPGSAEWHALRAQDVTSTEVAALYGASPYITEFELHHRKRAGEVAAFTPTERMRWGQRLEEAIALGAAEQNGWTVSPWKQYLRLPEERIGSSFDYRVLGEDALLECKNVAGDQFRKGWVTDGERVLEAPLHIELQVQHQMLVAGVQRAYIAVLVGGNQLHVVQREADAGIGADIRRKVEAFWASVADGVAPKATPADADFIVRSLRAQAGDATLVVDDATVVESLRQYAALGEQIAQLEALRDAAKANVLLVVGDAGKVKTPVGTVSCGMTKGSLGTLVTPDMVDTYINARSGYRQFRFTPNKTK